MFERFKFRKFNPSQEVIIYANTMLSQVLELAPDGSSCYASLSRVGENYTAWIEIASPAGHFSAESKAEDPRTAVDVLDDRIRLKIKKWKESRRFQERGETHKIWHSDRGVAS